MQLRPLGRTGLDASVLAFNARGLDARVCGDIDLDEAGAALALALDGGVNLVTVPSDIKTQAASAELLRRSERAGSVHLVSQLAPLIPHNLPSPHLHAQAVFPAAHIRQGVEATLKAFGAERLALVMLPAWQTEWTREGDWLETLRGLKTEGKIAGFGVAPFDHDPGAAHDVVEQGLVDAVEVMFNPFDPEAAEALFPVCLEKGAGVIVRSPLYGGAIAPGWGEADFPAGDWRTAFFYPEHREETRERVARLAADMAGARAAAEIAIRFALSHAAVSTVSVGMRARVHAGANLAAASLGPLDAQTLSRLSAHKWLC